MRIELHQHKCVGAGQCVAAAPKLFDQNEDDGIAFVLQVHPAPSEQQAARNAARVCPALAIHIHEDE